MLTTLQNNGLDQIILINRQTSRIGKRSLLLALGLLLIACLSMGQATPTVSPQLTDPESLPTSGEVDQGQPATSVGEGTTENQPTAPESPAATGVETLEDLGSFEKGSKIEIDLNGPALAELDNASDRAAAQLLVTFSGPDGQEFNVPAFYVGGDSTPGANSQAWKVRFAPTEAGEWTFSAGGSNTGIAQQGGTFSVSEPSNCQADPPSILPSFDCLGRLVSAGGHYLKFTEGSYWVKGGVDDPENFLGSAFGSWDAKKAAADDLSSKGVNSIYVVTNNIDGDNQDTWPWAGSNPAQAKQNSNQFDEAKLDAWEDFFTYVQDKGIVLHIVLNDDGAWVGYNHQLYLQEMVARFGHHPALIWNIGEEANESFSTNGQLSYASLLRSLDPYDHPVTVHRKSPWPFLGEFVFDLTSIQPGDGASDFSSTNLEDYYEIVIDHRSESAGLCHSIPIMIDETPRVTQVNPGLQLKMRSQVLYPIYLAGGNYEMHYFDAYSQGGGITIQELTPMLDDMRRAREFVETLPFQSMSPCNQLLSQSQGAYCFGKTGEAYAVYRSNGGTINLNLSGVSGSFNAEWYNPRTGVTSNAGSVSGGGLRSFLLPDFQDWALRLLNETLSVNSYQEPGLPDYAGIQWLDFGGAANQLLFLPMLMTC